MRLTRQSLRVGIRTLAKHRGFSVVAITSLALAIALDTTMYSVMDALVNPQVAMTDPDRLYMVGFVGDYRRRLPAGSVQAALQSDLHGYESITGFRALGGGQSGAMIEHGSRYHEGRVIAVRPNYFAVLGVGARDGRVFGSADTTAGAASAVISARLAEKLFPAGTSPVGRSIVFEGEVFGVVGVVPNNAEACRCVAAWTVPPAHQVRSLPLNVLRLRAGVSTPLLERGLGVLAARLALAAGDPPTEARFALHPLVSKQFEFRRFHYALAAAVVAVLLVACFNLANMQVARGISRARELAVRVALGASRLDLVTQLFVESALLAVAGLICGLLLTVWGVGLVAAAIPQSVGSYIVEPQISWRVLVFAVAASVLCLLIVGFVPAIRVSRVDPNDLLKSGAGTGAHKRNQRRYAVLVVAQLGLALALLSGAALVTRQAWRIGQVRFGFDPKPLATAWRYFERPQGEGATFPVAADEVLARLRAHPDLAGSAAYTGGVPDAHAISITDPGGTKEIPAGLWGYRVVTPAYLRTLKLPIVAGRDFLDGERDVPVVIIDRKTARSLWPNSAAVGSMIKLGEFKSRRPWMRVVGVVGDETDLSHMDRSLKPKLSTMGLGQVYVLGTRADTLWGNKTGATINVVGRARRAPERLPLVLRRALLGVPGTIMLRTQSMETTLGYAVPRANHEFVAAIFGTFAALALLLASLGIYGLVSYSVADRRREIGVRIALGASSRSVLGAILREGNALALSGVAFGLLLTKYTAGWLTAFSMEDDQYDAAFFGVMAIILFAITLLAALVPALRATRIDPVEALRSE
jgi:putative ABC transport system permease protein